MRAYPQNAGVTAGQTLELCVEPGTARFRVAFYLQGVNADMSLTPVPPLPPVQSMRFVTRAGDVFTSAPVATEQVDDPAVTEKQVADVDWQWPRIAFTCPAAWTSGVYLAAVYPVNEQGQPSDALGQAIVGGGPIYPYPPNSDGMALFVVRPAAPVARIAYVVALSNYHAYNFTGNGCFYYGEYNGGKTYYTVTLRRPGGGVGSADMWQEADPYDTTSRRNTYAHWDSKWVSWLARNSLACDFYTSLDLSAGAFLMNGATPAYRLLLIVGHDEYWDQAMRDHLQAFRDAGGNVAVFSGNTCFRPVSFAGDGAGIASESRLAESWTKVSPASNESTTIGVSFVNGGGTWNTASNQPPAAPRKMWAVGYTIQRPGHWVFSTVSPPPALNLTFGQGQDADTGNNGDHLVGYEFDGVREPRGGAGQTPCGFQVLALGLVKNQGNSPLDWLEGPNGSAAMGIDEPGGGRGSLFNAGTTDWARLLTLTPSTGPTPDGVARVRQITLKVIQQLSA